MWQSWINGIIGIWMVVLSFVSYNADTYRIWFFWLGIIVAILAFWAAASYSYWRSKE